MKCSRDAVGAPPDLVGRRRARRANLKNNGGSYLSSHDMREKAGHGAAAKPRVAGIRGPQPSGRTGDSPTAGDRYIIDQ